MYNSIMYNNTNYQKDGTTVSRRTITSTVLYLTNITALHGTISTVQQTAIHCVRFGKWDNRHLISLTRSPFLHSL